ncbi:glycolate oxidase subunit GlcE [Plasticicumulans acidivorans]|uniref:Glycolate oxidase FAD binding subunit n=1 Tax=Plasticicumulans acidivorans TaxID=886464 RepID=A0A317MVW0_9GAMM|nr:glycolate oxidase subunit GlcE [Plasticicumulans acidivorans]PWV62445.1 glycolate oxidase FAD binding subunit [Plasticicumulans acidivorans]
MEPTHESPDRDCSGELRERVLAAARARTPLAIRGGGSKAFYGREAVGEPLEMAVHRGIVAFEPTELYLTARAGTPLAEIEAALAAAGQMLGCESPAFGPAATLGGTVACGFSGPRRPYVGALRDFVLGMRLLNGAGELLHFGGQVMKNVAGYDVSRLQTGALGTLGVLLEISLKTLPRPAAERTLVQDVPLAALAIEQMNRWAGQPLPLSASAWDGGRLYLRLSGATAAVAAACDKLGGECLDAASAAAYWMSLREQTHAFFAGAAPLWRLSVAPSTPPLDLPGPMLIEWGGGQRWWRGGGEAARLHALAAAAGGHATLFRGGDRREVFQPLAPALAALHARIKASFDPHALFNPGRLYAGL